MASCSCMFVAATGYADTPAADCVRAHPNLGAWETAFLIALPSLLAGIVYVICRGKALWKKRLVDMAPSLFIVFLVYALAVAYAAGWWGACDTSILALIATLVSYGAVLSTTMFGAHWAVYCTREKGRLRYVIVPFSVMATTALAHNMLQAADKWGPQDIGATLQSFAVIAMVATAAAAAIFDAKYAKNRGRNLRYGWILPPAVLIAVGILAQFITPGAAGWVDGDDIKIHIIQAVWAGVAVMGGMLGARATESSTKLLRFWLAPVVVLVALTPFYHGVSSEWVCLTDMASCVDQGPIVRLYTLAGYIDEHGTLRPWILVTTLLSIWNVMMAMAVAMLGAAMATRVRPEHTS